ncbi:MAG: DUF721 domain-containing protein [Syntrophorhabdaceae bacterium]|nr:DUF721 domain-containing protein [Syntrophorhabdaceae bacterium]
MPLSVDIESWLAALGNPEVSLLVTLRKAWPSIMGALLADKTFPEKFRNGVLMITVCNHAWAQELHMSKPTLLSKIIPAAAPHFNVSDLRFVVGTIPPPEDDQTRPPDKTSIRPGLEPEELSEVADPETKEILRSIIRGMRIP